MGEVPKLDRDGEHFQMKIRFFAWLGLLGVACGANSQVMGGPLEYTVGGAKCEGYLAYDAQLSGKRPGILIIHDWNSIDDYERGRAAQLAKLGYVALVADIYGRDVRPKTPNESGAQAGKFKNNRELFRERLLGALDELKKQPNVDQTKIAAIGYCFGGTGVLEMARAGVDIKGVVSFHGGLDADPNKPAGPVIPRVLVCHGADDPFVPADQVAAFKKEFASAKLTFISYPGAVHAFTVPQAGNDKSKGAAYQKEADEKSWADMLKFFAEILK